MQRTKSNALWKQLTADQLKMLDQWLFEEKLSLPDAHERAKTRFRFEGSASSLKRYRTRRRRERTEEEFKELKEEMAGVSQAPVETTALQSASMKLLGKFLFEQLRKSPESVKELTAALGLMVQHDRNEVRRDWLKFAKEKFQFDAVEHALKALPQLKELEEARKDPDLADYEENAMINKIRREAFGVVYEAFPESAKEEEEMLAARRERQAQKQREAEARKNRERILEPEPPLPSSPHYPAYLEWKAKNEGTE
jgi:hypothetical protein